MTENEFQEDKLYPLLLKWRDGDKRAYTEAMILLRQEFYTTAQQFIPHMMYERNILEQMFEDFLVDGQKTKKKCIQKLIPQNSQSSSTHRMTTITNYCLQYRNKLLQECYEKSISKIPEQKNISKKLRKKYLSIKTEPEKTPITNKTQEEIKTFQNQHDPISM